MMKNIKNKLVRAYAKMVLKRLGKVAITLENNYIRRWYEEGDGKPLQASPPL